MHTTTYVSVVTFSSGLSPLWLSSNEFSSSSGKAYQILQKMDDPFFPSKGNSIVITTTGKINMPAKALTDSSGTQDLSVNLLAKVTENAYDPGKNGIRG